MAVLLIFIFAMVLDGRHHGLPIEQLWLAKPYDYGKSEAEKETLILSLISVH